jgi:hypothetical protein
MSIVETRKQHAGIKFTQSFDVSITTIGVEMVVAPNIDVVRRGKLISFTRELGSGSHGVSAVMNLSQSLALLAATTRFVGTLQMVLTNLIMITHVNRTID